MPRSYVPFSKLYEKIYSYYYQNQTLENCPTEKTVRNWLNNRLLKQTVKVYQKNKRFDYESAVKMLKQDHDIDVSDIDSLHMQPKTLYNARTMNSREYKDARRRYQEDKQFQDEIDADIDRVRTRVVQNAVLQALGYEFNNAKLLYDALHVQSIPVNPTDYQRGLLKRFKQGSSEYLTPIKTKPDTQASD